MAGEAGSRQEQPTRLQRAVGPGLPAIILSWPSPSRKLSHHQLLQFSPSLSYTPIMAPLVLDSRHLQTTNPSNNLKLGPAMPTKSNLKVKPMNRKTRRKALRTLRAALKYLGYT